MGRRALLAGRGRNLESSVHHALLVDGVSDRQYSMCTEGLLSCREGKGAGAAGRKRLLHGRRVGGRLGW